MSCACGTQPRLQHPRRPLNHVWLSVRRCTYFWGFKRTAVRTLYAAVSYSLPSQATQTHHTTRRLWLCAPKGSTAKMHVTQQMATAIMHVAHWLSAHPPHVSRKQCYVAAMAHHGLQASLQKPGPDTSAWGTPQQWLCATPPAVARSGSDLGSNHVEHDTHIFDLPISPSQHSTGILASFATGPRILGHTYRRHKMAKHSAANLPVQHRIALMSEAAMMHISVVARETPSVHFLTARTQAAARKTKVPSHDFEALPNFPMFWKPSIG